MSQASRTAVVRDNKGSDRLKGVYHATCIFRNTKIWSEQPEKLTGTEDRKWTFAGCGALVLAQDTSVVPQAVREMGRDSGTACATCLPEWYFWKLYIIFFFWFYVCYSVLYEVSMFSELFWIYPNFSDLSFRKLRKRFVDVVRKVLLTRWRLKPTISGR